MYHSFWSNYMAPLAPKRFNNMQRIITEIILFGGIGFLTYFIGDQKIALIYLILITFNTIFDHIL
ncbi:DUF2568 domain-containing protein [Enterococcus sp. AZ126]|uniref:DUF2568 domain-containing protein n=1 Tax=Enterococcus sp. AZ126 TaxID=2774635 RepID=UPI003F684CB4